MRITQNMLNRMGLDGMQTNMRRLAAIQAQANTGKRVNTPEDDPYAVEQTLNFRARLKQTQTIQENVTASLDWLSATDTGLSDMAGLGTHINDLALRGTSSSYGPSERQALANEANGILEQALVIANTCYGDRYIFSGFQTDTPAFVATRGVSAIVPSQDVTGFSAGSVSGGNAPLLANDYRVQIQDAGGGAWQFRLVDGSGNAVEISSAADGTGALTPAWQSIPPGGGTFDTGRGLTIQLGAGPAYHSAPPAATASVTYGKEITAVTYQGDSGSIVREISPNNDTVVNVTGDPLFTSIFSNLATLREELRAPDFDPANVKTAADAIKSQMDKVLDQGSAIGTKMRGLETISQRQDQEQVTLKSLISKAEDADMADVITQLTQQKFVYQSSLQTNAQILRMSLLDFLQ
jgi:flagellar hook-associated protein 3